MSYSRAAAFPLVVLCTGVAIGTTPLQAQEPAPAPLELTLYRTLAPNQISADGDVAERVLGADQITAVDAVAELDPRGLIGGDACSYRVRVSITAANGETPVQDEWRRTVSCEAVQQRPDTRLVDTFRFHVRPGMYQVEMTVLPSVGGEGRTASAELETLPGDARLSDLFLAREVGSAGTGDWPVQRGGVGMALESDLDVARTQPFLGYYLELYRAETIRTGGVVEGAVLRPGGTEITKFTLQSIDTLVADRPVAGTVSLAGLPVGSYEFEVRVRFVGEPRSVRRRQFRVVERDPAAEAMAARRQQQPSEIRRYFEEVGDSALTRFDAVVLWLDSASTRERYRCSSCWAARC